MTTNLCLMNSQCGRAKPPCGRASLEYSLAPQSSSGSFVTNIQSLSRIPSLFSKFHRSELPLPEWNQSVPSLWDHSQAFFPYLTMGSGSSSDMAAKFVFLKSFCSVPQQSHSLTDVYSKELWKRLALLWTDLIWAKFSLTKDTDDWFYLRLICFYTAERSSLIKKAKSEYYLTVTSEI